MGLVRPPIHKPLLYQQPAKPSVNEPGIVELARLVAELKRDSAKVRREIDAVKGETKELRVDIERLGMETEGLKRDVEGLEQSTKGLKRDIEGLQVEIYRLKKESSKSLKGNFEYLKRGTRDMEVTALWI